MSRVRSAGFYLLVAVIVVQALFPLYYAVITAFKSDQAIFEVDYWPSQFSLRNYVDVLSQASFAISIANSVFVAGMVVAISLLLALTAAYALSRIRFRGRSLLLLTILSVSMLPQVAVLAGLFEMIRWLGLYNSLWSLVLAYMIFTLPFTVWVLTAFMRDLPIEIEEAAILDGASPWGVVTQIFLPLLWPAMVAAGLLAFIAAWNEFLFALTFTATDDRRTVPVAIALLSGATAFEIPWGTIMAASVVVTLPLVLLVLVFQRRIVAGLTAGSVK